MSNTSRLVTMAQHGDLAAFEELVEIYQNRIFSYCFQLTGSYEDAQDLAQEAFVRAFRSLKSFRQEANLGTWLRKIVTNLWINTTRRKKITAISLDQPLPTRDGKIIREIAASEESVQEKVEKDDYNAQIRDALMKLAPEFRNVLILKEVEGYSYEEIGSLMECSIGTVKSRLNRARTKLMELMNTRDNL